MYTPQGGAEVVILNERLTMWLEGKSGLARRVAPNKPPKREGKSQDYEPSRLLELVEAP